MERTGADVSLRDPELNVFIEIVGAQAYFYHERFAGAGVFPSACPVKSPASYPGGLIRRSLYTA